MNLEAFLRHMDSGLVVEGGSPTHLYMSELAQEAMRITCRLNSVYRTPEEIIALMTELTGRPVDSGFRLFPPFHTDCGKNITLGKNVFINSGCRFQDQGGITVGDDCQIGHCAVMATLNHGLSPNERRNIIPSPIFLGKNVWVGANATILQGVTIGDNAVIAAGAVVTKDVPANTVAAGTPARVVKELKG